MSYLYWPINSVNQLELIVVNGTDFLLKPYF